MSFDTKDNTGVLFKNDKKSKDTHPDYTGRCMVDGKEHWISCWVKTSKNGGKFMSLAFKVREFEKAAPARSEPRDKEDFGSGSYAKAMDDEIPFSPEWR